MTGATDKPIAAKMVFVEAEPLDLRAHRAVKNEDAFACRFFQGCEHITAVTLCPLGTKKIVKHGQAP
jgi:hypothetical protein